MGMSDDSDSSGSDSDSTDDPDSDSVSDSDDDMSSDGDDSSDGDESSAGDESQSDDDNESNDSVSNDSGDDDTESQDDNASNDDDDTDVDSQDDTNGDGDNDDDDTESEEEYVDPCADLTVDECGNQHDDDGNQVCGLNVQTDSCYEVVESRGVYGRGNFDEGYNAAQQQAVEETANLNLIVGIMGAVIGVLVLVVVGGAYFVYQRNNKALVSTAEEDYGMEMGDLEDGVAGIDTADSAALMSNPVSP